MAILPSFFRKKDRKPAAQQAAPFGGEKQQGAKKRQAPVKVAKPQKAEAQPKQSDKKGVSAIAAHAATMVTHNVIAQPLISEKSSMMQERNTYVFRVNHKATKHQVKAAVLRVYGIEPISVRTIAVGGKKRRYGRVLGNTKAWKKAIVTLPEGKTIDISS